MNHFFLLLFFAIFGIPCVAQAQDTEFKESSHGLIYSDQAITKLKFIVDSLNLKFKVCDLTRVYKSMPQAKAYYISLEKGNMSNARKDLNAAISFEAFIKKYPKARVEKDLLVVKFKYKNYEEKDVVEFSSIASDYEISFDTDLNTYDQALKGKWIYSYSKKTKYSDESLQAFYFVEEVAQQPLPEKYAKKLQYSDCLVDTTTQVLLKDEYRNNSLRDEQDSQVQKFITYVNRTTRMPEFSEEAAESYNTQYQLWDSLRYFRVDSLMMHDPHCAALLSSALEEAKSQGGSSDELEEYVGRYHSKKDELQLKRSRRVVGGCSMDDRPRIHALNIAQLSAETTTWEVFLRAHLDIMNDRFERQSDGSYAWKQRKTYIKELEVLDINVLDLLLGISLRIENSSPNHYFGNIGRLGRALAETSKSAEIEAAMLQMISDNQLDRYNRVLMYYLFLNYNYNLENKQQQAKNAQKLTEAIKSMPIYLASQITAKN